MPTPNGALALPAKLIDPSKSDRLDPAVAAHLVSLDIQFGDAWPTIEELVTGHDAFHRATDRRGWPSHCPGESVRDALR